MIDDSDYVSRRELVALRREVAALRAAFVRFRRREDSDAAIEADFLDAVGEFASDSELGRPWSAGELLVDACHARRLDLLRVIETITGSRGNEAVRLGCWLASHAGAEANGYRLLKVRKESNAWLFSVARVEGEPI